MLSHPRSNYSNVEEARSLNQMDDEIEVPLSTNHYPAFVQDRTSKRMSLLLKICLFFIIIFLLLTVALSFVYASKGHPGFYWLAVGLVVLASISAFKLHWMNSADWDNKVKCATIAQSLSVIFLCMGLMAVMYGPNLKDRTQCSVMNEQFYIGGYITGLDYGGLQLGTIGVQVPSGGTTFTLGTRFVEGTPYTVSVIQQPYLNNDPSKPVQFCRITNPSGTMGRANITSINVRCDYAN